MNTEIHLNEPFGYDIYQTVIKYGLSNNLEIGSWDGEGSTRCFVEAMKMLASPKELNCIEIVKDKFDILSERYISYDFVKCHNCSSISYEDLIYRDFEQVWNSEYNNIRIRGLYPKELVNQWFDRDLETIKTSNSFDYKKYDFFDGVLIDGSEFTGYSEFKLLKDKTKVFFLDDVHSVFKCYQIYDELMRDDTWTLVTENPYNRNGYAIFSKNSL
jgi:hypothetical protein